MFEKIDDYGEKKVAVSTTTGNTATPQLTYEKILQAKKLIENRKVPLAEYMRKHGFDPDKGDMLVIPEKNKAEITGNYPLPSYVKTYETINSVFMVKNPVFNFFKDIKLEPPVHPNPIHHFPYWGLPKTIDINTYFDDRMIPFETYKRQKIYRTAWHTPHIYKATWHNGERYQSCNTLCKAKRIIDIALFFSHKIHEVKL